MVWCVTFLIKILSIICLAIHYFFVMFIFELLFFVDYIHNAVLIWFLPIKKFGIKIILINSLIDDQILIEVWWSRRSINLMPNIILSLIFKIYLSILNFHIVIRFKENFVSLIFQFEAGYIHCCERSAIIAWYCLRLIYIALT